MIDRDGPSQRSTILQQTVQALGPPSFLRRVGAIGHVGRWRHDDAVIHIEGDDTVTLVLSLSDAHIIEQRHRGQWRSGSVNVGGISILDHHADPMTVRTRGRADVCLILIATSVVDEMSGGRGFRAFEMNTVQEAEFRKLSLGLLTAARRDCADDSLLVESTLSMMAHRLGVSGGAGSPGRAFGGLTTAARRRVEALVASRLDDQQSPALREMAEAAGLSDHHFIKAFRRSAGETPYAHVLRRRLERGAKLLTGEADITDVALRTGFTSSSHFVSAFRAKMGVTPGAFRAAVKG